MVENTKKYWQSIRGLGILAVVLIHSFIGFNYENGDTPFIFVRQIINFAVATFVFMAGYFVNPEKYGRRLSIQELANLPGEGTTVNPLYNLVDILQLR